MKKKIWIALALLLLLGLAATSAYTVDRAEYVYVTQFGRHVATHDGKTDAGLHFKVPWPVQTVQRLDLRLQFFDLPATELPTRDAESKSVDKMLNVVGYVCWQVAGPENVDRFIRTVGTPDRVREILGQRVRSRLGAEIGSMSLDELISVAPAREVEGRMDRLQKNLMEGSPAEGGRGLKDLAKEAYGIEVVDVRLRRFNYPQQVHDTIYARIRSEREKKATEFLTQGDIRASAIRSEADLEAAKTLTDANAQKQRVENDADVQAREILTQAQSKDWQFYYFLESLKNGQSILGASKDVLVLSGKSRLFDFLFKPPQPNGNGPKPPVKPSPGAITSMTPKQGGQ